MIDLQERYRWKKIAQSTIVLCGMSVLCLLLAKSVWGVWEKASTAQANREKSDVTLRALQGRKDYLDSEIKRLSTARGVEEELRSKYQVTKPGEEAFVVVDEVIPKGAAGDGPDQDVGWWGRLMEFLFGR